MTDNRDYRKYLDLRFETLMKLVSDQSTITHEWLSKLESHAERTNGRVRDLENKLVVVEKDLLSHPMHCDKGKDIDKIESKVEAVVNDLEEYRIFKKYPRLVLILVAALLIGLFLSIYATFKGMDDDDIKQFIKQEFENIGTPIIVNQRGEITNLPAGDSLKYYRNGEFKDFEK